MTDKPQLPYPTRAELKQAGINIVVGVPMERQVPSTAFHGFWRIASHGWPHLPHPYGRVEVQRNTMAVTMMKHPANFTHLCMLDLDHEHPHDVVHRLAKAVYDDPEKLVVGGLNFRRGEPFDPCIFVPAPDGQLKPPLTWPKGLIEVGAIGHGSILISRKVFEKCPGPWWQYVYQFFEDEVYPSEDIYFSTLCEHFGIKIWCDTTIVSPHLIEAQVDETTFRTYLAAHPGKVEMYEKDDSKVDSKDVPQLLRQVKND